MTERMDTDPPIVIADDANNAGKTPSEVIVLDDDEICDLTGTKLASKCINYECEGGGDDDLFEPPSFCLSYYRIKTRPAKRTRKRLICAWCYAQAVDHYDKLSQAMIAGVPLSNVPIKFRNDVFEIDDSDSDSEDGPGEKADEMIDGEALAFLHEEFDRTLSEMVSRHKFEDQVATEVAALRDDVKRVERGFAEVQRSYRDIRADTDNMIFELSSLMRPNIQELPALDIGDEPFRRTQGKVVALPGNSQRSTVKTYTARNATKPPLPTMTVSPTPAKATPTGTAAGTAAGQQPPSTSTATTTTVENSLQNTSDDVVVVPTDIPPVGEVVRPPLKVGETYYANHFETTGYWVRATLRATPQPGLYEIANEGRRAAPRVVSGAQLAYSQPSRVRLPLGARVVAAFRDAPAAAGGLPPRAARRGRDRFYPGVVAETLLPANRHRYLVFFDDGYAQYVPHERVYLTCDASSVAWEDVNVNSRAFVKKYLENYENRAMVRFMLDQTVRTEHNGKWYLATVINIDCSLVQVFFDGLNRTEWIYRGSTRFAPMFEQEQAAANRQQKQRFPTRKTNNQTSGPFVEFMRTDKPSSEATTEVQQEEQQQQQRSVARKSTSKPMPTNPNPFIPVPDQEPPATKIVYYTPRRQKPKTNNYRPHDCNPTCKDLIFCPLARMKGYSPLAKPLLCGFYRLLYKARNRKIVVYRAPCGRTLRTMADVHRYLELTASDLTVDLFDFNVGVRCLAEFMVESKRIAVRDLSLGLEECPITVCNYVDSQSLEFTNYSTVRMPMEGVNLNLDPDFLVCCDCTDNCSDRSKCACWKLTLQCLKYMEKDTDPNSVGYQYRRLLEPIFTGIYECNTECKCRKSCLNRVVQNPMQHKLQVFKTESRGWGIRSMNDIPQGSFVCIYAGSLLTEDMANMDGKSYGDEYLAELDFIETAERAKEDYEEDPYRDEVNLEKSPGNRSEPEDARRDDYTPEEDEEDDEDEDDSAYPRTFRESRHDAEDRDFVPSVFFPRKPLQPNPTNPQATAIPETPNSSQTSASLEAEGIRSRLRKRTGTERAASGARQSSDGSAKKVKSSNGSNADAEDETVTISDDEDYAPREPLSFGPSGASAGELKAPRRNLSVRELFGKDEAVYVMDAMSTGNIGRFLNHSCSPNIFVQNVFVDTHDPRFPWVAFFTMCHVRAGAELTWNYNYDIGSVPGKVMYCYCGSKECKGRLL